MNAAIRNATYEDLLQVPDNLIAEILGGELITSPRPASAHALTTGAIHQDTGPFARRPGGGSGPGGWWILDIRLRRRRRDRRQLPDRRIGRRRRRRMDHDGIRAIDELHVLVHFSFPFAMRLARLQAIPARRRAQSRRR